MVYDGEFVMVSDKLYRRMMLGCVCGHVSRSMTEEARHRHNFPLLCKKAGLKKHVKKEKKREDD